jgi:hypothetical protein
VFAYAFDPADPNVVHDTMDIVAVDRFDADFSLTGDTWAEADLGLWPTSVSSYGYSIACAAYRKGELAPSYSERLPADGEDLTDEAGVYDPKKPMPTESNCPN